MLKGLMKGKKATAEDIDKIEENQTVFSKQLGKINQLISQIETVLTNVGKNTEKIAQFDEQLASMRDVLASKQCKLVDFEDRSQRNNLIVFVIPEPPSETNDDLRAKVLTGIFKKHLGVTVKRIERIQRLGKKCEDKARPAIMRFYDFNENVNIFKNCTKRKGSNISIANDL